MVTINNPAVASGGSTPNVASGLTAAGTNQATALVITTGISILSTVGAGTGVVLPAAGIGKECIIVNHGISDLLIYPSSGHTLDLLAANLSKALPGGATITFIGTSTTAWQNSAVTLWGESDNKFVIPAHASSPVTPAGNNLALFAQNLGGRVLPAFTAAAGYSSVIQPHLGRDRAAWYQPLGSSTTVPITTGLPAATTVGTVNARTVATTNIATRIKRIGYVSAATAAAFSAVYWPTAAAQYTTGTGAGLGGFTFMERFVVSDAAAVAGARMFIGMSNTVSAPTNVEPSTLINTIGFAQLSTDNTQWYLVYGGTTAQTAIALGTALGAPTLNTTAWDVVLFAFPGTAFKVGYEIKNLSTGARVTGTINGTSAVNMPPSTMFLAPRSWRCNNATLLAVGMDISSIYLATDL